MTLARLVTRIDADARKYHAALDSVDAKTTRVFGRVRDQLAKLRKDFKQDLGKGLAIGGGIAAAGAGLDLLRSGLSKVTEFIGGSIRAASDLNETLTKSEQIFGANSGAIEAWAAGAAASFGQSKRAALDAASGFAGLFSTVGIAIGDSTTMAKTLTQLGSDLASFFNTDVATALEAIRSGLAGESEPLRQFNVFLSETAVTSKLVSMGAKKVGGQFTESQKATARYKLILEQTTTAQGDFARTADGLANSQRAADAALENYQAELGQRFLPVALQVTRWQIDFIKGLDVVGRALSGTEMPIEEMRGALERLNADHGWGRNEKMIAFLSARIAELEATASAKLTATNATFQTSSREMGRHIASMTAKIDTIATHTSRVSTKVVDTLERITSSFASTRDALTSAASGFASAMWDPLIAKANLTTNTLEIKEQQLLIHSGKLHGIELANAQAHLAELNSTHMELLATLTSYGNMAARDTLQHQVDVLRSTKGLTSEQIAWLKKLEIELARARNGAAELSNALSRGHNMGGTGDRGRAFGGPVVGGQAYLVGEKGPEMFVPGASGAIIPNEQLRSGGGDTHVHVEGLVRAETPEDIGRVMRRLSGLGLVGSPS
jgi:hypothetical protein